FDVGNIALLLNKLMYIRVVITFVKTQVLLKIVWGRPRHNNGYQQVVNQPFVVRIGRRNGDCQRRTPRVHQEMNLATALRAACWTFASRVPAQWRWGTFAANGLPLPHDASSLPIKLHQRSHQRLKNAALLPFLKTLMQCAAAHAKPVALDC